MSSYFGIFDSGNGDFIIERPLSALRYTVSITSIKSCFVSNVPINFVLSGVLKTQQKIFFFV